MSDEPLALEEQEAVGDEDEASKEKKAFEKLKEAVIVQKEELGSLRIKMTITVPRDLIDERFGEQFGELRREALIPGFRKGHAPVRLVEKRFAAEVGDQLKGQLIGSAYLAAVEKDGLKPLGDPHVWVKLTEERATDDGVTRKVDVEKLLPVDKALEHMSLPKEGPLEYACEVELKPEFELPELDKIPVGRPKLAVDDDDVEAELRRLQTYRGTFEPVEEGPVELDDLLYADVKMSVGDDVMLNEQNVELAARDLRIRGVPLSGLGEALTGSNRDDVVKFGATVPDDHENLDLRGKTANYEFTIREIKRLALPPIDEEFLKTGGYESEDDLRDALRSALESRLTQVIRDRMHEQVGDYLVAKTAMEIPEGLSQRQTDRSVARRMIEMYQTGVPESEISKAVDEMRARAHDQVIRDLKLYFILEKIAEDREINVTEEQLNSAIAAIAQRSGKRFDRVRDELSKGDSLSTLYVQIRDQQVLDELLAEAEITDVEAPKKKIAPRPVAAKSTSPSTAAKPKAPPQPKAEKKPPAKAPARAKPAEKPEKEAAGSKAPAMKKTAGRASPKKTAAKKKSS